MRVLIFSLSYVPLVGGAEVAVKEITDRISPEEIEFDMVTLRFDKAHPKREKIGNVHVHRIGGGLGYLSKIFFVPQAALFALRRRYDLYWAMMTYMLFPVSIARIAGDRTPYALTLQDGDPFAQVFNRPYILPFRPLLSYGFRAAAKVQTISHFLADWARRAGYEGEVEVIPNGVDLLRFENPAPHELDPAEATLITTSRLVEKNGVGDIISAMKHLPDTVSLRILGTGPLERELRRRVKKLGLDSRVSFMGFVAQDDIPRHLHHADIFVRPSLSEGQGISFIEAMAASLPVIATPVGGIPDFLKDGETGLFAKPRDPESIARAVRRLIEDPPLRRRITEKALALVRERYGWDLIASEMKSRVFTT